VKLKSGKRKRERGGKRQKGLRRKIKIFLVSENNKEKSSRSWLKESKGRVKAFLIQKKVAQSSASKHDFLHGKAIAGEAKVRGESQTGQEKQFFSVKDEETGE